MDSDIKNEVPQYVRDVTAIEKTSVRIESESDIAAVAELPVREACIALFRKNIETVMSSANKKNVGYDAHIIIRFDTLSDTNKALAQELGMLCTPTRLGASPTVSLSVPVSESTTVADIQKAFATMVERFEQQPYTCTRLSPEEVADAHAWELESMGVQQPDGTREITLETLLSGVGQYYYFAKDEGLFYPSESAWKRYHESRAEK